MLNNKKHSGFTLIEIMIAITIIAILSAIAYPNYSEYVKRSRRADAQDALTSAMQKQEVFYANNARYGTTLAQIDVANKSVDQYYSIQIMGNGGGCAAPSCVRMQAIARAKGGQNTDKITRMRLWSTGRKQAKYNGSWKNSWTDF